MLMPPMAFKRHHGNERRWTRESAPETGEHRPHGRSSPFSEIIFNMAGTHQLFMPPEETHLFCPGDRVLSVNGSPPGGEGVIKKGDWAVSLDPDGGLTVSAQRRMPKAPETLQVDLEVSPQGKENRRRTIKIHIVQRNKIPHSSSPKPISPPPKQKHPTMTSIPATKSTPLPTSPQKNDSFAGTRTKHGLRRTHFDNARAELPVPRWRRRGHVLTLATPLPRLHFMIPCPPNPSIRRWGKTVIFSRATEGRVVAIRAKAPIRIYLHAGIIHVYSSQKIPEGALSLFRGTLDLLPSHKTPVVIPPHTYNLAQYPQAPLWILKKILSRSPDRVDVEQKRTHTIFVLHKGKSFERYKLLHTSASEDVMYKVTKVLSWLEDREQKKYNPVENEDTCKRR